MDKAKVVFFFIGIFVLLSVFSILVFLKKRNFKKPVLKVLTYSSFAGVYGPGRTIKKRFEAFCNCNLQWFLAEDSTALLQRFAIIPNIDLVIGWDQITLFLAKTQDWEDISFLKKQFVEKKIYKSFGQESFLRNPYFLPLDWSPIGFIYRDNLDVLPLQDSNGRDIFKQDVYSLKLLYNIKGRISFPEPHSSTLGLQFYYWLYSVFKGDRAKLALFLQSLKNKVYGPFASWSLAYGFFQKKKTNMGLSYLSSIIYHKKEEPDKPYFFAYFTEGHPYQMEFVSVAKRSKNKDLALKFAQFLVSSEGQKIIRDKHYMFSVSNIEKDSLFLKLICTSTYLMDTPVLLQEKKASFCNDLGLRQIGLISYNRLEDFIHQKKELLKLWENNLY